MTNVDSAVSSLVGLNNVVTSMAQQWQCVMANVDSATWSPVGLSSAITSMGRQWHCATTKLTRLRHRAMINIVSAALSPTWLRGLACTPRLAIRLGGSQPIRLGGLRSTTPIGNPTQVHFYLHRQPRLEASALSPQWYETLCQTS
jgi:hypothetical protein